MYINTSENLFCFSDVLPSGTGWELSTAEQFNALRAAGWEPAELILPWRVEKDTIMLRVSSKGDSYVLALDDVLLAQPRVQQILWRDFAWFMSDNPNVRALITAIGLSPDEILASTS